jgi:hypothetical protein
MFVVYSPCPCLHTVFWLHYLLHQPKSTATTVAAYTECLESHDEDFRGRFLDYNERKLSDEKM